QPELFGSVPTTRLDTENRQLRRLLGRRNDSVACIDSVLLPAQQHLASYQDERSARSIPERQPVDLGLGLRVPLGLPALLRLGSHLRNAYLPGLEPRIERDELIGGRPSASGDRKDGQVFEFYSLAQFPLRNEGRAR